MRKLTVFISHSYSHIDSEWVHQFANALKQQGVNVWLADWQIAAGESFVDALESGLRASDVIVAILSPHNVASPNVLFEIGFAVGMGKKLIPIVPQEFDKSTIPFDLLHYTFLVQEQPEKTAREVIIALEKEGKLSE